MADKIKDLIKTIPELEPERPVEQIIAQTLKRQLIWLWEQRLAIVSGFLVLVLGYLTLVQTERLAQRLGTAGFWSFLSQDKEWFFDEPLVVLSALLEANPWQEVIYLIFLLAILSYCLYTLLQKMSRSKNLLAIGTLFVLIVVAVAIRFRTWPSRSQSSTPLPQDTFWYSEEISSTSPSPSQADFFLEVSSPQDGVVVKDPWVVVNGRTTSDSEVFINDKQISPDKNGNFSIKIDLVEGVNPVLIVVGNEVGDQEIERVVYYELQ
jgi:hypothetical protein